MRTASENSNRRQKNRNLLKNEIRTVYAIPVDINLFKFNNKNTRKWCEICSKLTIKTPE